MSNYKLISVVGTLQQGYLLLLQQGRTRVVIHNYVLRGGTAGPQGSGSYLTRPTAPDPFPALGTVPVTPRVPEKGKLRANSRGPGPHRGPGPPRVRPGLPRA